MEADLAEVENMAGDDIVGRRVKNDVFNRRVFYGTVAEYVKIDEPREKDIWQVTYEDEDTGDYYRNELLPLTNAPPSFPAACSATDRCAARSAV